LQCDCGGRMRIVAAVTDPASVRRYLDGTGQSAEVPTFAPARAPPQAELDFDCEADFDQDPPVFADEVDQEVYDQEVYDY